MQLNDLKTIEDVEQYLSVNNNLSNEKVVWILTHIECDDIVSKKCLSMIDWSKSIDNFDDLVPIIMKFPDIVDWYCISKSQKLSESFIREFADKVDWYYISERQKLSEPFIREFADKMRWYCISIYQKLSEPFIREFADRVYWDWISSRQKLSEPFIREFSDRVEWGEISIYQKLSEDFIREFDNRVDWYCISTFQKLSEGFIREYAARVNWYWVSKHQQLSESFINEFKDKLDTDYISDNWHYKSADFKKEQVRTTGLYECHDDYFIAYKGIRSDRYSKYNFQYQYLPGETYECFADHSDDDNSFGLSVWDYDKAKEYCDELVVKCKVYYSNVARVVHNGGKIRCSKITVLD